MRFHERAWALEARFLEGTLSSLPYKLAHPDSVLILGGSGALHVWSARLSSARSIVLVEPDRNIVQLLYSHRSRIPDDSRIRVEVREPRAFLDIAETPFDIIHLADMEGFAAAQNLAALESGGQVTA